MHRQSILRLSTALLVASATLVSAQVQLPSAPMKQFGAGVTPAWEGWFDNPDGTHSFLIGYYNRNTASALDVPIGVDNGFEPGDPDRGQPTHFLPGRQWGMFTVTVPKEFSKSQRISWKLTVAGVTTTIPFSLQDEYNISPLKGSNDGPDGSYNLPPILRFSATGPSFTGPVGTIAKAISRTAVVGTPMPLELWIDDDARFSGAGSGPRTPPARLRVDKYRGPGTVTLSSPRLSVDTLKGGKPMEPYSGKAATALIFSQAGDYVVQVIVNDYSGNGGGGFGCCWTTAMVRVSVQ